ncbi:MAG: response regulator [Rhodospirillaceae bacterium]|nr:response regulator [Rhodospirillaceae bacterium]
MATTVLIAEDEPHIREGLTFLISRAGHQVVTVSDGAAAVEQIIARRPDLVVLDIMIPELNGFEVMKRVRATPGLEALPVLVLSAKGQEADRQRMMALGANQFVTKPFSNRDLMDRVNAMVSAGSAGAEPTP